MSDELDFGPLACLIGVWEGDKGLDIAPEPDGTEESPYYETITFEAVGDVTNAEKQTLMVVRYHQVVSRKSNGEVFHDETGYWMWDAENKTVAHSLVIPRAVAVLAGGTFEGDPKAEKIDLLVKAALDSEDWGIIQSPFMRDNARTTSFVHKLTVEGDRLSYREVTMLDIYGKEFKHVDSNELTRK